MDRQYKILKIVVKKKQTEMKDVLKDHLYQGVKYVKSNPKDTKTSNKKRIK